MKQMVLIVGLAGLLTATGPAAAADGKKIYEEICSGCHSAMSPKTGDKAAWAARIKKGVAALTSAVMKGKGAMPPKGGAASQLDVKAAVDYMVDQSK
jgi:cytochrome c5